MAERESRFPAKLSFLFDRARYKVAHGGRGSGKSWNFARALLIKAAHRKLRVLCVREIQKSIADSVHKLLSEQISALGLEGRYEIQKQALLGRNGSEFIFSGVRHNVDEIKSKEGIDILWAEEAQAMSEDSWKILLPTVRKNGSEIWVTFNPDLDTDPTYQRFVVHPPPNAIVAEVNWKDNPWFPDVLHQEMEYDYSRDPESADHIWLGKTRRNTNAQILRGRYIVESFDVLPEFDGPYYGADWGFAQDPTVLVKVWEHGRKLYVDEEAWGVGVDIHKTPHLFEKVSGARDHVIRADSSRPETISYMRQDHKIDDQIVRGFPKIVGAQKGEGSLEDGVTHLRSYEQIIIRPSCIHAADEARLYSYKVDRKTKDVMPEIVDKNNHVIDAIRYALEPIIRSKTTPGMQLDLAVGAAPSYWKGT